MSVKGKNCIVTGSARGIGKAIGISLVNQGANVLFADLNGADAEKSAKEARNGGAKSIGMTVDVTQRSQVRDMIARAVKEFGRLDVVFNNAGINKIQPFMETTEENWDRIMKVNALSVLICMQEAARQMISQGQGGKIVNTASIAGRQGYPNIAPYCASKFAVISLTQSAARELAKHKITVNGFAPGVVDTPLWEQIDREHIEIGETKEPGEAMRNFAAGILLGRVSKPDDITGLTSFLASSASDYITGQTIVVDGGMVLL
jgi:meso-butanediol dehydrogenase / (S,S)-butanediol dehydrogenase / diacetyl reductase